ncbi:MAG: Gfo/Idh/MocA family oxidoreductase [Armatimonadota bacterium]|nr:Gfo/Idh/MocA family oxidoreductase [Armatimonadota bacterium]
MGAIKVGVIGVGRGMSFARGTGPLVGLELVALCDTWEEKLEQAGQQFGVETYTDYDRFLEHDMDAVILANYFHEHAPFAIKALEAGKHVMSETSACFTLAEGVELIRTVERTGLIYMFAENYPYMVFNQEMRRLYQAGEIGTVMYAEGEYIHPDPAEVVMGRSPGIYHWRNWIPATYYCTHSLAPIVFITETWPEKVNGFIMVRREDDPVEQRTVKFNDASSMIALRMDNGAVVRLVQVYLRGHGVWVRLHGSRGAMENLRWGDRSMLRVRREQYHEERQHPEEVIYRPDFPDFHEQAMRAGHGGGDFFMNYHFAEAIRRKEPPFLDVYRGVTMSIIGPLAYRSALSDSNTIDVPDFRREEDREAYEDDDWRPDPREGDPWPSIEGRKEPTEEQIAFSRQVWRERGYEGE